MKSLIPLSIALMTLTSGAFAEERTMTGAELKSFLPGIAAKGGNTYQTFEANGHTDYFTGGRKSEGRWAIREDKYCSVWPPSDLWACYDVVIDETEMRIFWVEANGAREKNRYEPRN